MPKRTPRISGRILEEASAWLIDFDEGVIDAAGRDEFNAWLRRSPEHVRAYLQISTFWEDADRLGKRPHVDLEARIERASVEHNVFALELAHPQVERKIKTSARRARLYAMAASVLVALGVGVAVWHTYRAPTYQAEVGEQRSMTLADGSSVTLNSRSRMRVDFSEGARNIVLLEGQALFKVARDTSRPFIVTTGSTEIRALGTQFDVYRRREGTVVTVIEGRVAVRSGPLTQEAVAPPEAGQAAIPQRQPRQPVLLSAGEQLEVTPASVHAAKRADVAAATAWTEKKLIFHDTPLRAVVEEFNRYNRRQLVIQDPALYEFHLSGVFPSTDAERVLELLRQRFAVTIHRTDDEIEIARAPAPADL